MTDPTAAQRKARYRELVAQGYTPARAAERAGWAPPQRTPRCDKRRNNIPAPDTPAGQEPATDPDAERQIPSPPLPEPEREARPPASELEQTGPKLEQGGSELESVRSESAPPERTNRPQLAWTRGPRKPRPQPNEASRAGLELLFPEAAGRRRAARVAAAPPPERFTRVELPWVPPPPPEPRPAREPAPPSEPVHEDLSWKDQGLCAQIDPDAFFPEKGGSTREAKAVCQRCDVRETCLAYALKNDERFGIWGGKSERERRKLKKAGGDQPAQRQPREHERAVLRLHREQLNDQEIAVHTGLAPETVLRIRRRNGLPPNANVPSGREEHSA